MNFGPRAAETQSVLGESDEEARSLTHFLASWCLTCLLSTPKDDPRKIVEMEKGSPRLHGYFSFPTGNCTHG